MNLTIVCGTRPNFVKVAAIVRAVKKQPSIKLRLVHTGQHSDVNMSGIFFKELGLPKPNNTFGTAKTWSSEERFGFIMYQMQKELAKHRPDMVMVVGDVDSTLAAAIATKKANVRLAHVEAGLRSGDRSMPEEINRLATDAITDLFFTTSEYATAHLFAEGYNMDQVHEVGNVMIDTLEHEINLLPLPNFGLPIKLGKIKKDEEYLLLTLHRPQNVDNPVALAVLLERISSLSQGKPVLFPVHPRTWNKLGSCNMNLFRNIKFMEPMGYRDFIATLRDAMFVITDSGGVSEEASYLYIPCITLRPNTERPETVDDGTNYLATDIEQLPMLMNEMLISGGMGDCNIPLWDGHAADRIVEVLMDGLTT